MKAILINYNFTPDWIRDFTDDYLIYDRSDTDEYLKDFPKEKIIKTQNVGNVDYDRLGYLVEHYDDLPDVFLWSKSNLFKYITPEEFEWLKDNQSFTPLLTRFHQTGLPVSFYDEAGMYNEINNSWYLVPVPARHYKDYGDFAEDFGLPNPDYLTFAPGGNYILTRGVVHKHPIELYARMRERLPYTQLPGEAQMCERSYYTLWS